MHLSQRFMRREGLCDLQGALPAPSVPVTEEPSALALEWEMARDQLRYLGASIRWELARREGRLHQLEWWSLEDALPYWY